MLWAVYVVVFCAAGGSWLVHRWWCRQQDGLWRALVQMKDRDRS